MEEYSESRQDKEITSLIQRFEDMLQKDEHYFFDAEDFEDIIDYFLSEHNLANSKQAIEFAIEQHPSHTNFLLKKAQYFLLIHKSLCLI